LRCHVGDTGSKNEVGKCDLLESHSFQTQYFTENVLALEIPLRKLLERTHLDDLGVYITVDPRVVILNNNN
jgi:hypothetical protein